jgi:hypothetical protein
MVWSKVPHNQWTELIVRFGVLQNHLKNQTKPNQTFPNWVGLEISLGGASKISATVDIYSCRYTLVQIVFHHPVLALGTAYTYQHKKTFGFLDD